MAAADQREFRFNKFGSVGRAAGFLLVSIGYLVRSIVRGYEGPISVENLVAQLSPLGATLFAVLFVGLSIALVRAIWRPQNRLILTPDEVVLHGKGKPQRVEPRSIVAVAALVRDRPGPFLRRHAPLRSVVVLADSGTNLAPVPSTGRWLTDHHPGSDGRDLVEEILAEGNLLSELPNDEFGNTMRRRLGGQPGQQVAALVAANPELRALVIPLQGMPRETEDELRATLPHWI